MGEEIILRRPTSSQRLWLPRAEGRQVGERPCCLTAFWPSLTPCTPCLGWCTMFWTVRRKPT